MDPIIVMDLINALENESNTTNDIYERLYRIIVMNDCLGPPPPSTEPILQDINKMSDIIRAARRNLASNNPDTDLIMSKFTDATQIGRSLVHKLAIAQVQNKNDKS